MWSTEVISADSSCCSHESLSGQSANSPGGPAWPEQRRARDQQYYDSLWRGRVASSETRTSPVKKKKARIKSEMEELGSERLGGFVSISSEFGPFFSPLKTREIQF